MALDRQIARVSKLFVDNENISFDEAQARLRSLTLEVFVGPEAASPAAHAAILTAVSVGSRTFIGGVRVKGALETPFNSAISIEAETLREAVILAGASEFEGRPSRRIVVGNGDDPICDNEISPWWNGWEAGTAKPGEASWDTGDNPLAGIAAGSLAAAAAFEAENGHVSDSRIETSLWPVKAGETAPHFGEVFLPGALWLVGLGNLGQAFLWALASLPYLDPTDVSLVLQDFDKVDEENWATSVLAKEETYGLLKTRVAEGWALKKGFDVRRIDRGLMSSDQLEHSDPRLALSGVDKVEVRKQMAEVGFDCIIDAGLGRNSSDFDRYRVTMFDHVRRIDKHFAGHMDELGTGFMPEGEAYKRLEKEIGACGTAEMGNASVAVPYVSAFTAAVVISRAIAVVSGCECPSNEVGRISSLDSLRVAPFTKIQGRGLLHAGKPNLGACL